MPFDVATYYDLEDYHTPCPALAAEARRIACRLSALPRKHHPDQGYPLRGGHFWVTDHRTREWMPRPGVSVAIRIDGREGKASTVTF